VTRRDAAWLDDVTQAVEAIRSQVARGPLSDDFVMDAVRIRLLEIGEAVKSLSPELTATEPDIPWRQIARMRAHVTADGEAADGRAGPRGRVDGR